MTNTDHKEAMHMRTPSKLILATLAATALLALVTGGASARNFSTSERNFEFIWNNALTGKTKLEFIDNVAALATCNITFLGSFLARTIAKVAGKIGEIRHAEAEGCAPAGSSVTFMALPWDVNYVGFTGTLPNIATVKISVVRLAATIREALEIQCVVVTEGARPAVFILEEIAAGAVTSIRAEERTTIPLEPRCAGISPMSLRGKGLVLNLPRTAKITLTLI